MRPLDQASRRRLWAIARCDGGRTAALVDALRLREFAVILVDDILRGLPHDCEAELAGLVLCADSRVPLDTAATVCQLRLTHPTSRLFVLVEPHDATSASVVMRQGGQPVPNFSDLSTEGHAASADSNRFDRWIGPSQPTTLSVMDALASAVHGHLVEAIADVARAGDDEAALLAVDQLTSTASAVLERIEDRASYSVPARLVIERLAPGAEADMSACIDMLERAASRRNVIDFDIDENVRRHGQTGVLFGAFHAAYGLIQFASDRWWRPAPSVLDDLLRAQHGRPRRLD